MSPLLSFSFPDKENITIPGGGLTSGIVGIGHDRHGDRIGRGFVETGPIILQIIAPLVAPDSGIPIAGLDGDDGSITGEGVGDDRTDRELVRPDVDQRSRLPEKSAGKNEIDPGSKVVAFLAKGILACQGLLYLPGPFDNGEFGGWYCNVVIEPGGRARGDCLENAHAVTLHEGVGSVSLEALFTPL